MPTLQEFLERSNEPPRTPGKSFNYAAALISFTKESFVKILDKEAVYALEKLAQT